MPQLFDLTNVPAFLIALGVIVFFHELGHYLVAKLFGVRVLVFSVGFGKRLFGFQRGDTDYRVSMLPLGGYVFMAGQMPEDTTGRPDDFLSQPRWQRILIYLAGPAMNLVLAIGLVALALTQGIQMQGIQDLPPVIGQVVEDSAGEAAGLEPGDRIVSVDGEPVDTWTDFDFLVGTSPEKPLELEVARGERTERLVLVPTRIPRYELGDAGVWPEIELRFATVFENTPAHAAGFLPDDVVLRVDGQRVATSLDFIERVEPRAGEQILITVARGDEVLDLTVVPEAAQVERDGQETTIGRIGVSLGSFRPLPIGEALSASVRYNLDALGKILQVLGKLVTRDIAAKSALSGPIEIAAVSGTALKAGVKYLIFMMGLLSLSIGVMNLLPIPVLDGGHIAILVVESLMRRDLSLRVKEGFARAGFVALVMLMVVVVFFDLSKHLPGLFGGA